MRINELIDEDVKEEVSYLYNVVSELEDCADYQEQHTLKNCLSMRYFMYINES